MSPIVQWASSRPYTPIVGFDINGDDQTNIVDRLCEGTSLKPVFAARGNLPAIRALNPNGCKPVGVNTQRSGFVVNPDSSIDERSGRFFNPESLSFTLRPEQSSATSASGFLQPVSLYGPGFGPPVGRPFTASFGGRFEF